MGRAIQGYCTPCPAYHTPGLAWMPCQLADDAVSAAKVEGLQARVSSRRQIEEVAAAAG